MTPRKSAADSTGAPRQPQPRGEQRARILHATLCAEGGRLRVDEATFERFANDGWSRAEFDAAVEDIIAAGLGRIDGLRILRLAEAGGRR